MGRNPLKSHEIANSDISRPNDFNDLRSAKRNQIVSQAKFPNSQAKFSASQAKHFGLRRMTMHRYDIQIESCRYDSMLGNIEPARPKFAPEIPES
jgi:hypothetical protein